ncbi:MAG: hypothetical protein RLZ12_530 [Bacillota bacterium]|jgi:hypothetical protein
MLGYIGQISKKGVTVYSVPLLYCPVCCALKVHPAILDEFELVLDFALEDEVDEVIFCAEITDEMLEEWSEECISFTSEDDLYQLFQAQVDHSLALLSLSRILKDDKWREELKHRLKILTCRIKRLKQKEGSNTF